jgi:hypothetical protein
MQDEKKSPPTWMTAIFLQPYFLKTFTLVGLWTVAEGWVRNRVGNLVKIQIYGANEYIFFICVNKQDKGVKKNSLNLRKSV